MSGAEQTIASLQHGGSKIIIVGTVMAGVAAAAVVLRFVAKSRTRAPWGMDDVLISLSLAIFATVEGLTLRAVVVGSNARTGTDADFSTFLLYTYVFSLLYWSVIASATASVLFLYRSIFFASPKFRRASVVLILLVGGWWVSGTLADALAWQPTRSYWDTHLRGNWTIQYNNFWLASMVLEMVLETATLVLPIRELTHLSLSWARKLLVGGLFLMGGLVLVSGVVRIYYAWAQDMTPGVIWLTVHSAVAIVSACLPTYRALFPAKLAGSRQMQIPGSTGGGGARGKATLAPHHRTDSSPPRAWPAIITPPPLALHDGRGPHARMKSVDSSFSQEPLTALPPMSEQQHAPASTVHAGNSVFGGGGGGGAWRHLHTNAPQHQQQQQQQKPPRRTLFAEVDRGLKQLKGRPESNRFDWRRSARY